MKGKGGRENEGEGEREERKKGEKGGCSREEERTEKTVTQTSVLMRLLEQGNKY